MDEPGCLMCLCEDAAYLVTVGSTTYREPCGCECHRAIEGGPTDG